MRTSNPTLNAKTFDRFDILESAATMTLQGTVIKTGFLLFLVASAAIFSWSQFVTNPQAAYPMLFGGAIGGFVLAIITTFKKEWSPVTAPLYAALEGLFLGVLSASINAAYPGIALQAICLTFGTLFCLLTAYQSGLIRATEKFKLGVVAATGGIFVVYLTTMVLSLFGVSVPFIHDAGLFGIGFSLFVVVVAALNLVLDFDFIEQGVERRAPKFMEWYGAFGLIVTLVWLYIEILRLLSKLNRR